MEYSRTDKEERVWGFFFLLQKTRERITKSEILNWERIQIQKLSNAKVASLFIFFVTISQIPMSSYHISKDKIFSLPHLEMEYSRTDKEERVREPLSKSQI